jgi:hypothetical protein
MASRRAIRRGGETPSGEYLAALYARRASVCPRHCLENCPDAVISPLPYGSSHPHPRFAFIDVAGVHQHADGLSFNVVVRTRSGGGAAPNPSKAKQTRFRADTTDDAVSLVTAICARAGIVASS